MCRKECPFGGPFSELLSALGSPEAGKKAGTMLVGQLARPVLAHTRTLPLPLATPHWPGVVWRNCAPSLGGSHDGQMGRSGYIPIILSLDGDGHLAVSRKNRK
jgi:hypothetical protein